MVSLYNSPSQLEPFVIEGSRPVYTSLIGQVHELAEVSAQLDASLPSTVASSLAELVSGMNCYYSNLIEGHHTYPVDIEEALLEIKQQQDYKSKDLHSLAMAHIAMDRWARSVSILGVGIPKFLLEAHGCFCELLPKDMLRLKDGSYMEPGKFRDLDVEVGQHVAPDYRSLAVFLEHYANVYGIRLESAKQGGIRKLDATLATFCGHHRLAWIHPFPDGNGRVARIVLDAMLRQCGINGASLWSMSRGLAKTDEEYKLRLAQADMPRFGECDGRGNLSEKKLVEFCEYAIRVATDQAKFMRGMFSFETFNGRAEGYFHRVRFDLKQETSHLYLHAFRFGEFERMEAARITGLRERAARDVLTKLLNEGFLVSDSPKGKVRIGFPVHALGSLLPNLYPAGDVDFDHEATLRRARAIRTNLRALRLKQPVQ